MKAKLIKTEVNYILEDDKGVVIASTSLKKEGLSLSLKNCQAIEVGYDLDELAKENAKHYPNNISQEYINSVVSFKDGFQKALEILGDKKFSEGDMIKAFELGEDFGSLPFSSYSTSKRINKKEFIQSLQQTEWDVEVEMEQVYDGLDEMAQPQYYKQPKLDANECLILKTFKSE